MVTIMNTTKTTTMLAALALGLCLAAHVALAQQQNKGDVLLQEARHKEIIDGNLEEAISLYQKIVDNVSDIGRAVKARALVQMGKSYEKLGVHLVAEARQAYEQVVRDYPDQPDMVAEARSRLEAFQAAVTDAAGPDQPKGLTVRRVTPIQNRQAGEVSPDGRYVSFANYATGNMAVYNVRTGEHRDITNDGTWDEEPYQFGDYSVWSPDSKQLAYFWLVGTNPRPSLRIVDMDGGEPRIIAPFSEEGVPYPQAWSQDGKYILALNAIFALNVMNRIVMVDVETGSTRTIKELPDGILMHMSLSPDGKYVLYESFTTDQRESRNIHILSTDGQLDQPLIDHPANDRDPTWTPDGRHVVFVSNRSGQDGFWSVPIEQGRKAGEAQLITQGFDLRSMGFTDDGTLYYGTERTTRNIFVVDLDFDAGTWEAEPQRVSTRFEGASVNARSFWSPDGSRLAYWSRRGSGLLLVVRDMESGAEQDFEISNARWRSWPQWSPDGTSILVGTHSEGNEGGLLLIDVNTGRLTPILTEKMNFFPVFLPHGQEIIFMRYFSLNFSLSPNSDPALRHQFVLRHLESGSERVLREQKEFAHHLAISPDGAQLAYFNAVDGQRYPLRHLVVMSLKDASTRTLWSAPKEGSFSQGPSGVGLNWMPDGKHLLLATREWDGEEAKEQLYLVNVESGERKAIGPVMQGEDQFLQRVDVHPNGRTISFSRGHNVNEVWAIENLVFDQ